jgi:hypothetical protein
MAYAAGKRALGLCDRCGFTYKLSELKYEIEDQVRNGLRVCSSCFDQDHPQLQLGKVKFTDPQALYNPRADSGEKSSTSYYAFNPVGGGVTEFGSSTVGLKMTGKVGKVKVVT